MRHRHSIGHWIAMGAGFVVIGTLAAFVFGYVTMLLWNWLVPAVFGLKAIDYWQAVGLLFLSWLFFGRFRGGHWHRHGRHWRHRLAERWMRMSPEERERFRDALHEHWDHHEPPASGNPK
jgi:hypothetical protein